jgi:hypothetical protein
VRGNRAHDVALRKHTRRSIAFGSDNILDDKRANVAGAHQPTCIVNSHRDDRSNIRDICRMPALRKSRISMDPAAALVIRRVTDKLTHHSTVSQSQNAFLYRAIALGLP